MMVEKPDKLDFLDAEDICRKFADYIQERWPYANFKSEINTLKEAADILATYRMDDEEER